MTRARRRDAAAEAAAQAEAGLAQERAEKPAGAGQPASSEAPASAPAEGERARGEAELAARLAEAEAKRDEYLADLQRLAAEFDNYRKRAVRDQERLVAHAHERLVRELLPILDDLERALEAASATPARERGPAEGAEGGREAPPAVDEHARLEKLVEGVRLVEQKLRQVLAREGVVEIGAEGRFDPHVHEALLSRPGNGAEPGSVLEVVQRGYRIGDRVVRPARVIVAE
ncbi:MAG TPA: nucleotide exchange factor GrpE [Gaiellaceae bacterium]|nr:nucleotide exchange factor GrpE [Gaiellaceae bacterium]